VRALLVAVALTAAAATAQAASDTERLRELHEKVMRAHRHGDVELILQDEGDEYVVASRGEITRPSLEQRRERLGPYLRSTTFEFYRDAVPPLVTVSRDGTLGWAVVQVEARGIRKTATGATEPVEFVSAWIEMYAKRDGKWLRVGNVSNFKP